MLTFTLEILMEPKQRSHEVSYHFRNGILVWNVIVTPPAHSEGLSPSGIITDINSKVVHSSENIHEVLSSKDKASTAIVKT